jgi:hypothetical protein
MFLLNVFKNLNLSFASMAHIANVLQQWFPTFFFMYSLAKMNFLEYNKIHFSI